MKQVEDDTGDAEEMRGFSLKRLEAEYNDTLTEIESEDASFGMRTLVYLDLLEKEIVHRDLTITKIIKLRKTK